MNNIISLHSLYFIIVLLSFAKICVCENESITKSSIDEENREDTGEGNDDGKEDSLSVPADNEPANITCTRRQNSRMHEIRKAGGKQFPFVAALMSHQNEYLCSSTVIANGLLLTTAKCLLLPVSYVLLNTTKDKKEDGSYVVHIYKTEKFPSFTGGDSLKDVGLIFTEHFNSSVASKIAISNYTTAKNLVDIEGIGFGLNADIGQQKDLQYVGMEIRSLSDDILSAFFDCVETKEPLCYKDRGGPIVNNNELIGIVLSGQDDCLKQVSSTYAINKKMVDILPAYTFKAWVDEKIAKNEGKIDDVLPVFPSKRSFFHSKPTRRMKLVQNKGSNYYSPPKPKPLKGASIKFNPKLLAIALIFAILCK